LNNCPGRTKKWQTKLLYQDTDLGEQGKTQTKLLYTKKNKKVPKSFFSRKDKGAGRVAVIRTFILATFHDLMFGVKHSVVVG
jgi:hypothetical protein